MLIKLFTFLMIYFNSNYFKYVFYVSGAEYNIVLGPLKITNKLLTIKN